MRGRSAAAAAGRRGRCFRTRATSDRPALDQLHPAVVRRSEERDARAAGVLDRSLQQLGPELLQARDVGLEVLGVEPEVLQAVMGHGVTRSELLAGAGAGDVDGHAAVLAQ